MIEESTDDVGIIASEKPDGTDALGRPSETGGTLPGHL